MLKFVSQNKELNTAMVGVEYDDKSSTALHKYDDVAPSLAIFMEDQNIVQAEHTYFSSWPIINNEIDTSKGISAFTSSYYDEMGKYFLKYYLDEENGIISSHEI